MIIIRAFDIVSHKCKATSETLVVHICRTLTAHLGISSSIIDVTLQYDHQSKSIVTVASIVQNSALMN